MMQPNVMQVETYTPRPAPPPPPSVGRRILAVVAVVAAVIAVLAGLYVVATSLGNSVGADEPTAAAGLPITVTIPEGASARTIGGILEESGLIGSASEFERAVRDANAAGDLRAGQHTLLSGSDIDEIISILTRPQAPAETYRVTTIEGLTVREMLDSLAEATPYTQDAFATALLDGSVTTALRSTPPTTLEEWEGLLFPNTYEYLVGATPDEILQRMASTMEQQVEAIDWGLIEEFGVNRYEAIIVASLIEAEAKLDVDRPLIASVIYNRLRIGMALQIDATIIYALGDEYDGQLTNSDKDFPSDWNTYYVNGLPPTPIAGVRLASLEAAAQPAETDYLFYVLVDPSGAHGFSATLEEHNEKVAKARAEGVIGS